MSHPLFPIKPQCAMADATLVIEPHCHNGIWVFDDPSTGLVAEPFVSGITEMIDRLTVKIPNAVRGFRLLCRASPFEGFQLSLT